MQFEIMIYPQSCMEPLICFPQLRDLPESMSRLSQLKVLDLFDNKLPDVPDFIYVLPKLAKIDLELVSKQGLTYLQYLTCPSFVFSGKDHIEFVLYHIVPVGILAELIWFERRQNPWESSEAHLSQARPQMGRHLARQMSRWPGAGDRSHWVSGKMCMGVYKCDKWDLFRKFT